MSDRPLTQQRLVTDLAGLVDVTPQSNTLPFLAAFWGTMARQWASLDVLRMDKFLLLVRAYLGASFRFLGRHEWDSELVQQHTEILETIPLNATDSKIPDGLRYHVLDVFVDELDKADTPKSLNEEMLTTVMKPVRELSEKSVKRSVRTRAKNALEDERLADWSGEMKKANNDDEDDDEEGKSDDDDEWGGIAV